MKQRIFKVAICFFLISNLNVFAQEHKALTPIKLLQSNSIVQDKNFYLFTAIQQVPSIKQLFISNEKLANFLKAKNTQIAKGAKTCGTNSDCHFSSFLWSDKDVKFISTQLRKLYSSNTEIKKFIQDYLRPTGYYQNYVNLSDEEILIKAWEDAAKGMNHIINVYGKGIKPMYPSIDSIGYNKNSTYYRRLIDINSNSIASDIKNMNLFFEPSLQFAINLLDINDRFEASSYEPLALLKNKATIERIKSIDWDKYKYAIILVPGYGPEKEKVPLSPVAKFRLELAVERYRMKLAPIIMVSGGRVHPYQTPYCEALEMKKFLIERYHIPKNAILVEPHARHTTTNFRNAARLIYRSGIPFTKKDLVTTTKYQSSYISNPNFKKRCLNELGYIPYVLYKRLNQNDIEFVPVITSLQRNSMDPLDP